MATFGVLRKMSSQKFAKNYDSHCPARRSVSSNKSVPFDFQNDALPDLWCKLTNETFKQAFLDAADAWVCDGYSVDIRFIAEVDGDGARLWDGSVALNPLPAERDIGFRIESTNLIVGQIQRFREKKRSLLALLDRAADGVLQLPGKELPLPGKPYRFYSEMSHRERWFSTLHLQVSGGLSSLPSSSLLTTIDNTLRASQPPFDGLDDAATWLGLVAPGTSATPPSINIRVGPPVDLIFDKCALANDRLRLTLHAHPRFDVTQVVLAVRATPGNFLDGRKQVSSEINWGRVRNGRREGKVQIDLQHADNVLTMLMIGGSTVRRQWFLDPAKARNNRLLAIQHFDKDLRMVRQAVLESPDSSKFEQGVAALLFLLGFSPSLQLENDSPDLIVTTPGGRLAIVECTTRIADFPSKLGKLVDRRGALSKSLVASGHPALVSAVLVCRLPRDQIATHADELRAHNTILVTGEDLAAGFDRVRFPSDPDHMLDEAHARISGDSTRGLG